MPQPQPLPLLTIAGSDSGGAAGLQADLKTWAALSKAGRGLYGMVAVTVVTVQNSVLVQQAHFMPPEMVAAQIDAVLSDYGAAAIKTGFIGRVELIEVIAERLAYWAGGGVGGLPTRPPIVVDPVLVNHRGEAMFAPEVAAAYRALLFPLADLVTPNRAEAVLLGMGVDEPGRRGAGEQGGARRILLKGVRRGAEMVDVYWDGERSIELPQPRIETGNTHGSGDTLSAAVCATVAQGHDWPEAIRRAQSFTHAAIRRGATWRMGTGHGPVGVTSDE